MTNYFDYDYLSELVQDANPAGVPVVVNLFLHKQDDWPHEEILYIIVVAPGKGHRTLRWYWKVQNTGPGIITDQDYKYDTPSENLESIWKQSALGNLEDQWLDVVRHYIQNHNLIVRAALPANPLEKRTQPSCLIDDLNYQCMAVIVAYRAVKIWKLTQDDQNHDEWVYVPFRQKKIVPIETDPDDGEKHLCPGEVQLTDEKAIAALIEEEKHKHKEKRKP